MQGKLLQRITGAALLCAILTSSVLLASCDYWFEDWYKNGEDTTTASNGERSFYDAYMCTGLEMPDGTKVTTMSYEQYTSLLPNDTGEVYFLFFSGNRMTEATIAKSNGHQISIEHTGEYTSDPANRKLKMTSTEVNATADGTTVSSSSELVNYQSSWGWSSITSYSVGTTVECTYAADKKEIRVPASGPTGAGTAWTIYTLYNGSLPAEFSR